MPADGPVSLVRVRVFELKIDDRFDARFVVDFVPVASLVRPDRLR